MWCSHLFQTSLKYYLITSTFLDWWIKNSIPQPCHHLCFCFVNKFIYTIFSDSTYKRYHMIFVFLWLHSVWQSRIISGSIHVTANSIVSFFNDWVICHVYMYHMFFIHSSADGQLGCFHVLDIVNSAAVDIGVHISLWIMVFSGYMPRNGLAGSYCRSICRVF